MDYTSITSSTDTGETWGSAVSSGGPFMFEPDAITRSRLANAARSTGLSAESVEAFLTWWPEETARARTKPPFSPPYITSGLYEIERRKQIEAPNRATVKAIFQRRAEERATLEWERKVKQMHDQGIHYPGYCPYCPSNVYYD